MVNSPHVLEAHSPCGSGQTSKCSYGLCYFGLDFLDVPLPVQLFVHGYAQVPACLLRHNYFLINDYWLGGIEEFLSHVVRELELVWSKN